MSKGFRGLGVYLWKYRHCFIPGLITLVVSDGCQLLIPLIVRRVVDALTLRSATAGLVSAQAALILLLTLVVVVARFAWRHFMFSGARLAEIDLRKQLLEHALSLPASHYSRTRTGEVMALATNDLPAVRMALAMGLVAGFDSSVFALVALLALLILDWRLTLWTALPLPVLCVVMTFMLKSIYHRWDAVQVAFERLTEKARESLAGVRVLRAYAQEEGNLADFESYNRDNYESQMRYIKVDAFFQPAIIVLSGLSTAILLGVGGTQVVIGRLSLGTFSAFSSYLAMLSWPMIAAGWMMSLVQRGAASMARVSEMLESASEPTEGATPRILGTLEARGLTFTYPGADRPALRDLSFTVPAGGSLALVGEVGSGKSTVAMLLSRVYDPPRGTVFVDGVDVNDIQIAHLRHHIALVPQEAFLFSESIAENLRLGNDEADDSALRAACSVAALHDEILEFPRGYETLLGERGITLSGGQKQRVSLARALLKPAPILVLDDTLSGVDADTEARILRRLEQTDRTRHCEVDGADTVAALTGRTAVVISHRLSAVREADWIVVLREGDVIQEGTHADLVRREGYYRELYELQELERESPPIADVGTFSETPHAGTDN